MMAPRRWTAAKMREARLYLWGARTLYLGPAFNLSPHRNAVAVLCAGVAGELEVGSNTSTGHLDYVPCRTALIPANTLHHLCARDQPIAFLYVDAHSDDYATVRATMLRSERRIGFGLACEPAYLAALARLRGGKPWQESREEIAAVLRLHVPARRDERIAEAIRLLHAPPAESDHFSDFAKRANLSPSRFLHLFKATTGVPFRRYRLWARMGIAVRRIVGGCSLTQAAYEAGFSSSAHFSAAFREMFGMPPSLLAQFRLSIVESTRGQSRPARPDTPPG
jgi:AraC-like DNA-binding protein